MLVLLSTLSTYYYVYPDYCFATIIPNSFSQVVLPSFVTPLTVAMHDLQPVARLQFII